MLSIFSDVIHAATRQSRWDAPDHWTDKPVRGPVSSRKADDKDRSALRRALAQTGIL